MDDEAVRRALGGFPLFEGLPSPTLARIAAATREETYESGAAVIRQGDPCRAFFCVVEGAVRLFRLRPDGKEHALHRVGAGATFAEAAALTMTKYPASAAAAATPTVLLAVAREPFLRLFDGDPSVGRRMVASLSARLVHLVGRVEELSALSAGARLARALLDLPSKAGGSSLRVELPLAKKDLAAHLGITPETLSRLLRKWQDRGVLAIDGSSVEILDASRLMALSEDASA